MLNTLVFLAALLVFVAPGFPLARLAFGGPGPRSLGEGGRERLFAAPAIGYLVSSLLTSVLYVAGAFSWWAVLSASVVMTVAASVFARRRRTLQANSTRVERTLLAASVALALAIVTLPFLKVGVSTEDGVAYRAYFSADLMTHLSVVAELQKRHVPPVDPFYAESPLGYYWLFFLFPALAGEALGNQQALLLTDVAGGVLFAGLAFVTARRFAPTGRAAFIAVLAGLAAGSYEGLATLARAVVRGLPLGSFRQENVDAFCRWSLELTSIDGLHRSLLYTPQHLFSYSLLLVLIWILWTKAPFGNRAPLAGLLLGGMAGTSIVTAMLAGPWACLVRLRRAGDRRKAIVECVVMGAVSLLCLAWFVCLGFFADAGGALRLRVPSLLELPALVFFEAGALVLLAVSALGKKELRPLVALASMALLAILFLDVDGGNGVWMAWRAGSVLLVSLVLLAAAGVGRWPAWGLGVVLGPALLTTVLDVYNAQDVTNREESSGGFPWTLVIPPLESEALDWLRTSTPTDAVVQIDARARGTGEWALVPALAERRMAYGYPIFLLNPHKYLARGRRLRPIFNSEDVLEAHGLAREAGIRYVFVGSRERSEPQNRCEKFFRAPELFAVAFANRDVTIFEVR